MSKGVASELLARRCFQVSSFLSWSCELGSTHASDTATWGHERTRSWEEKFKNQCCFRLFLFLKWSFLSNASTEYCSQWRFQCVIRNRGDCIKVGCVVMLLHAINPEADSISRLGCCTCSESTHTLHSFSWDLNMCAHMVYSAYTPTPADFARASVLSGKLFDDVHMTPGKGRTFVRRPQQE